MEKSTPDAGALNDLSVTESNPDQGSLLNSYQELMGPLLLYGAAALIFWLLSDTLLTWLIADPYQQILTGFLLDGIMLFLTTVVFGLLLKRQDKHSDSRILKNYRFRLSWIFAVLAGVCLLAAALATGYSIQQRESNEIARLQSIADLKQAEVTNWITNRLKSLEYLKDSDELRMQYSEWQRSGKQTASRMLQDRLYQIKKTDQYQQVTLYDQHLQRIWGDPPASQQQESALFRETLYDVSNQPAHQLLMPYLLDPSRSLIDFMVPLPVNPQGGNPVVVFRANPAKGLWPDLLQWPVPNTSGDVVLFKQEDQHVVYLNHVRFLNPPQLENRFTLVTPDLLEAQVLRGRVRLGEVVRGLDYQLKPSLGVSRQIPDTAWYLLVKLDLQEVYAGMKYEVWLINAMALLMLIVLFFGLVYLYQIQKLSVGRSIQALQANRLRTQRLLSAIADSSTEPIFAKDLQGRYTMCNEALARILAMPVAEILGKDDRALFPATQAAQLRLNDQLIISRQTERTFETEVDTPTGKHIFLSNKGPLRDEHGRVIGIYGIAKEITTIKQIERDLREHKDRLLEAQRIARLGSWEYNVSDRKMFWSDEMYHLMNLHIRLQPPNFVSFIRMVHPDDRQAVLHTLLHARKNGLAYELVHRIKQDGGAVRYVLSKGQFWRQTNGKLQRGFGTVQDITDQKRSEEELRLAANVFSHALEGIMITSRDGLILDVNKAFTEITGYQRDEVLGKNPSILQSGEQDASYYRQMWVKLAENGYWSGEIWNRKKDGQVFLERLTITAVKDEHGQVQHYVALLADITELKEHQRRLEHIAHFDALTGLPNRLLMGDRIRHAIQKVKRRDNRLAVVYLDLDGFKEVNDTFGHDSGDQLLMNISTRMREALRESDTLARLGGDEFVAVLEDLDSEDASVPVLERLLDAASKPIKVEDNLLQVSASAGVTFYPQLEEVDADQLLRQADQAMYQAKLAGKNRYHRFDSEQDRSLRGHHESLDRIANALAEGEFVLHYQPKVRMRSGVIEGVEALIRWQHPERGLLSPANFLPVIENHPLSIELSAWVVQEALQQHQRWRSEGLVLPVSVNVSAYQIQQLDFVEWLKQQLEQHALLSPDCLMLEVLETSALEDIEHVSRVIRACSQFGVRFAMDDFGTGYSSLTYLKRLPAQQLKIDQSFVRDMLDDPEDLAILEGVLGLAQAFRRDVVAEGVENESQGELLLQLGCEVAQGYFIAKPMPAEQINTWVRSWQPPELWQRTARVSREDIPLLFACTEHRAWIRTLETALNGVLDIAEILELDPMHCNFGRWLSNQAAEHYQYNPLLSTVDRLHRELHQMAAELMAVNRSQPNPERVKLRLEEIYAKRDEILNLMRRMLSSAKR
ncbi:EAL domain-containing protein [Neptuniibacter sp. CAU 1671]|uniref:EAL domain-containing protein n=1 Tax=Neptuniibacter sp. CAU 1671 TaxID=3032593 RepID=UPI0023DA2680|nr:EAL domain-containing protein [Neptuniibacter sp. CAU 1671]MDF2181017.1 EAL domain-containing protein [Neptuniibacter sp. CAU 1671]